MGFLGSNYPKLFFFSPQLLCPSKNNSPKLYVWDITLNFICSSLFVPTYTLLFNGGNFLSFCHSGIVLSSCLFRLSNTLSELWVSNSHTRWH